MARIGFVGLGNMGGPMLLNLLKAGHQVSAFDLVESALARAKEGGRVRRGVGREYRARTPSSSSACCRRAATSKACI